MAGKSIVQKGIERLGERTGISPFFLNVIFAICIYTGCFIVVSIISSFTSLILGFVVSSTLLVVCISFRIFTKKKQL